MKHQGSEWLPDIDPSRPLPVYEQMVEAIAMAVTAGELQPGDTIPSLRSLAARLRINPNTSARAFRELERLGVIRTIRGVGCTVTDDARAAAEAVSRTSLERQLDELIHTALRLRRPLPQLADELERRWLERSENELDHAARRLQALRA